jgi:hypothetical protein
MTAVHSVTKIHNEPTASISLLHTSIKCKPEIKQSQTHSWMTDRRGMWEQLLDVWVASQKFLDWDRAILGLPLLQAGPVSFTIYTPGSVPLPLLYASLEILFCDSVQHHLWHSLNLCNILQLFSLTLSVRAEYYYSATSHATSPDGVLVLRDFHNFVKKKVLKILDSGLYH